MSVPAMHRRLQAPMGLSLDTILKAAKACSATSEELTRICVLDAMDRGVLPIPDGCSETKVCEAMAVLETTNT